MTQKTAVEWLASELKNHCDMPHKHFDEILEQAKQMEKKQIVNSYCDGFYNSGEGWNGEYGLKDIENIAEEINAEKYYNETYGRC